MVTYDLTTAKAVNNDNTRDDRWEVQAVGSDLQWWTVSDSSQMTQQQAEELADSMRSA